jgi:hypothetical protein
MLPERLVFCEKLHLYLQYIIFIIQARKRKDDLWDNEGGMYSTPAKRGSRKGSNTNNTSP